MRCKNTWNTAHGCFTEEKAQMEEIRGINLKGTTKETIQVPPSPQKSKNPGIKVKRFHTVPNIDPADEIVFEKRTSKVSNPDGSVIFEAKEVEIPSTWSQLATDIAASKYFRRRGVPKIGAEKSVRQLVFRVAHTIREFGEKNNYFDSEESAETFESELSYLLLHQHLAFNSPVWFNCGLYQRYGISGNSKNFYWNSKTKRVKKQQIAIAIPSVLPALFKVWMIASLPSLIW